MSKPTTPKTMQAWQYGSTSGGIEKHLTLLKSSSLPPTSSHLQRDQALVRVLACSVNPVDYKLAELPFVGRFLVPRPAIPSLDFAGRLVGVGSGVGASLRPGDLVFGRLDEPQAYGTMAEYVVAPTQGTQVIPDGVEVFDAAAVGTAGLAAYQSIVPFVKPGGSVFINGGSGGTGMFGIQIAKARKSYVVTTCSTGNVEWCKRLGADEVIDYKKEDVVEALKKSGRQFDLVVDNVGSPAGLHKQAHHFMKPEAKLIQIGAEVGFGAIVTLIQRMFLPAWLGGSRRRFEFVQVKGDPDDLQQMGMWMKEGKVKVVKDEVFSFEDAPKAIEKSKTGRTKGKIVIAGPL